MTPSPPIASLADVDADIFPVTHLDLVVEPLTWPFARTHRADIAAHFAARQRQTPELWNGRIIMLAEWRRRDTAFEGWCFETDYADFVAWRDWGFADRTVTNCFGMGALRGSDGAFVLGVMAAHTVNAGRVYFPAGTPDPGDVVDGRLDLAGSVLREVAEETGLDTGDFSVAPDWRAVVCGQSIAMMRLLSAREPAEVLRERIRVHLAREPQPELADLRIARTPADLDPMMPPYVSAFLMHMWT